jgi:hypothetical protein
VCLPGRHWAVDRGPAHWWGLLVAMLCGTLSMAVWPPGPLLSVLLTSTSQDTKRTESVLGLASPPLVTLHRAQLVCGARLLALRPTPPTPWGGLGGLTGPSVPSRLSLFGLFHLDRTEAGTPDF